MTAAPVGTPLEVPRLRVEDLRPAEILGDDEDVFTPSLHGARNYPFTHIPSSLDVDLPSGTGDAAYLAALDDALPALTPDVAFYLAGADPWEGDRLGRLSLTKAGLRRRDQLVRRAEAPGGQEQLDQLS